MSSTKAHVARSLLAGSSRPRVSSRTLASVAMLVFVVLGISATAMADPQAGGVIPAAGRAPDAIDWENRLAQLGWTMVQIAGALLSGCLLAFHPRYRSRVASLEEMDLPKIFITYTIIGAVIAVLVSKNQHMGLAIFGVGGLMRFRTLLSSAKDTGRLILAVVIGFLWGAEIYDMAGVVTLLAWVLIFLLDWRVAYRMVVKGLPAQTPERPSRVSDSADAYLSVLADFDCRVSQVKKNLVKGSLSIVFRASRNVDRDDIEAAFAGSIDPELQGAIDWPEEG